eukprot:sb/3461120/
MKSSSSAASDISSSRVSNDGVYLLLPTAPAPRDRPRHNRRRKKKEPPDLTTLRQPRKPKSRGPSSQSYETALSNVPEMSPRSLAIHRDQAPEAVPLMLTHKSLPTPSVGGSSGCKMSKKKRRPSLGNISDGSQQWRTGRGDGLRDILNNISPGYIRQAPTNLPLKRRTPSLFPSSSHVSLSDYFRTPIMDSSKVADIFEVKMNVGDSIKHFVRESRMSMLTPDPQEGADDTKSLTTCPQAGPSGGSGKGPSGTRPGSLSNSILINVGGEEFVVRHVVLRQYPDTLLGSAAINKYYRLDMGCYFFDRSRFLFEYVLQFYQTGALNLPVGFLNDNKNRDALNRELEFFRIQYELRRFSTVSGSGDDGDTILENIRDGPGWNRLKLAKLKLYLFLTNPQSSLFSLLWMILDNILVLLSISALIVESEPYMQDFTARYSNRTEDEKVTIGLGYILLKTTAIIEITSWVFFTIDFILRMLSWPRLQTFFLSSMNLCDLTSLLPYYIPVIIKLLDEKDVKTLVVLRFSRMLRITRIFRVIRHSHGLTTIFHFLFKSTRELCVLCGLFFIITLVFASVIHYIECLDGRTAGFSSIPVSMWWAVVTVTGIGYGDVVPTSWMGLSVASVAIMAAILDMKSSSSAASDISSSRVSNDGVYLLLPTAPAPRDRPRHNRRRKKKEPPDLNTLRQPRKPKSRGPSSQSYETALSNVPEMSPRSLAIHRDQAPEAVPLMLTHKSLPTPSVGGSSGCKMSKKKRRPSLGNISDGSSQQWRTGRGDGLRDILNNISPGYIRQAPTNLPLKRRTPSLFPSSSHVSLSDYFRTPIMDSSKVADIFEVKMNVGDSIKHFVRESRMSMLSPDPQEGADDSKSLTTCPQAGPSSGGPKPGSLSNSILINVGGEEFVVRHVVLRQYPDTLLGSAAINKYYRLDMGCYFFDRSRFLFEYVLQFYQTGALNLPVGFLNDTKNRDALNRELEFFRIQYELRRFSTVSGSGDDGDTILENIRDGPGWNRLKLAKLKLYLFLTNPQSSLFSLLWMILDNILVLLSISALIVESEPYMQDFTARYSNRTEDEKVTIGLGYILLKTTAIIEITSWVFFTIDFILRMLSWPRLQTFFLSSMNLCDLTSLLPYYIPVIIKLLDEKDVKTLVVLRFSRMLRITRIFRVIRHSHGLTTIFHFLFKSTRELCVLCGLFFIITLVFASVIHYIECLDGRTAGFSSIPVSMWWAVVTVTGIGYGDVVPTSWMGLSVASVAIMAGVIFLSLPLTVIVTKFTRHMEEHYYTNEDQVT